MMKPMKNATAMDASTSAIRKFFFLCSEVIAIELLIIAATVMTYVLPVMAEGGGY